MRLHFRNARKLLDVITHREASLRSPVPRLYRVISSTSYPCIDNPTQFFRSYSRLPAQPFDSRDSVVSWTSEISALVRANEPEKAVGLFKTMLAKDQRPNYVTMLSVIRAVGALSLEGTAWELHGLVIKMGFESEVSIVTVLMGVYSIWDLEIVWKLIDQMPHKDLVLWTSMVSLCVKNGHYMEALEYLRQMQYCGMHPNDVTLVSILPGCANLGVLSLGKQVHGFAVRNSFYSELGVQNSLMDMYAKCRNFEASVRVFNRIKIKDLISWRTMIRSCIENSFPKRALVVLSKMRKFSHIGWDKTIVQDAILACSQAERVNFGLQVHCCTEKMGFLVNVSVCTAIIQMYGKFGEISSAVDLFNELHPKDLIAWTTMILVHAQSKHPCNALDTYKQLELAHEKPNEITFVSLLQACSSIGAQELGESIQAYVTKVGYLVNPFILSTLVDFYCKAGRVGEGRSLFNEIPTRDLVCWSSMINGFGMNGYGDEALQTFSGMLNLGIEPSEVVFISVLSACSHCGLEDEGWKWFYSMTGKFGIAPKLAHYACMVDLLARRGNVVEAFEFVKRMPMEPDKRIWGALLSSCRLTCEYIEIAEVAADRLIACDPENASYYVILSNLYADQGKWVDVERMRKLADGKGLKKTVGCSMI